MKNNPLKLFNLFVPLIVIKPKYSNERNFAILFHKGSIKIAEAKPTSIQ